METTTSGGGAKAALLALMVFLAAVAVVLSGGSTPAGASELETFASCDELDDWMRSSQGAARTLPAMENGLAAEESDDAASGSDEMSTVGGAAPAPSAAVAAAPADGEGVGSTNVIVEGIDELDRVEILDGGRMLATGERSLHLVDVDGARSLAVLEVPFDAQVSYDAGRALIWVAGADDSGATVVLRVALVGDRFETEGTWRSAGWLLAGRRTGGGFHVVLTEGFSGAVPFTDGPVPCDDVLHPTGPAAPEATLIATLPSEGALEPARATEIVGAGQHVHLTDDAVFVATPLWGGEPATSLHRFDLATLSHTGSGRVDGYLLNEFALSAHEGHLRVGVTVGGGRMGIPMPIEPGIGVSSSAVVSDVDSSVEQPLNEIVVLDTAGDLDVVGRTPRFGLPDETLQGIRFVGETAYAVTFLQTDPFYVVDLADPAQPRVVGEVKLPGFSSYLHPVGDGMVVGFGPDGSGQTAAKLFDVSDPTQPTVVSSVVLGDDSPVSWDHHAYLQLDGDRFAVPATTWVPVTPGACDAAVTEQRLRRASELERQLEGTTTEEANDAIYRELDQIWADPCVSGPGSRPVAEIVEVSVAAGSLEVVSRTEVQGTEGADRVVRFPDRWAVLTYGALVVVPDAGAQVTLPLG